MLDVHSFGDVVLGIATGRKANIMEEKDGEKGLIEWVDLVFSKHKHMMDMVDILI